MSSHHPSGDSAPVIEAIRTAIRGAIEGAVVEVTGGGGHYAIDVVSPAFAGKGMLDSQRMVYAAITDLMSGDNAPVHAVDSLRTRAS